MGRIWVPPQTVVWVCVVVAVCAGRTVVRVVLNSLIHFERHVSIRHRLQKPRGVEPSRTWSRWVKLLLVTTWKDPDAFCFLKLSHYYTSLSAAFLTPPCNVRCSVVESHALSSSLTRTQCWGWLIIIQMFLKQSFLAFACSLPEGRVWRISKIAAIFSEVTEPTPTSDRLWGQPSAPEVITLLIREPTTS